MKVLKNNHNRVLLVMDNGRQILKCPVCGRPLITDDGDKWKLKTRIVIFLEGKTLAKCKYCRNDIEVPVRFNREEIINGFIETKKELAIEPEQN